jgi:hypothetical protein
MQDQSQLYKSKPEKMPTPTVWPFLTAAGVVFGAWGLLTSWIISVGGLLVFIVALTGWINQWRHE